MGDFDCYKKDGRGTGYIGKKNAKKNIRKKKRTKNVRKKEQPRSYEQYREPKLSSVSKA